MPAWMPQLMILSSSSCNRQSWPRTAWANVICRCNSPTQNVCIPWDLGHRQPPPAVLGRLRATGNGRGTSPIMVQSVKVGARGPLRVGVVGVGVMGSNHARVFADLPGVELVGVADPDRTQRELVSAALGCATFAGVEGLLAHGVDAVTIAAPTHLHQDLALVCIERGVHVMVEKPIASSVEEGRAIIAAARRVGVALMVGHVERFNPTVEAIKEAIRDEDILSIAITRVGPFPPCTTST